MSWNNKLLMSALVFDPKTPRAAYEIVKGSPSSDAEWATYGVAWRRNWDECLELYQIVKDAEEKMRTAYDAYLKSQQ